MKNPIKLVGLLGALAIVVSACGPAATPSPTARGGDDPARGDHRPDRGDHGPGPHDG